MLHFSLLYFHRSAIPLKLPFLHSSFLLRSSFVFPSITDPVTLLPLQTPLFCSNYLYSSPWLHFSPWLISELVTIPDTLFNLLLSFLSILSLYQNSSSHLVFHQPCRSRMADFYSQHTTQKCEMTLFYLLNFFFFNN